MTAISEATAPHVIELPARLDYSACDSLIGSLEAARTEPICLNAGKVGFLGAMPLELLLRAKLSWQAAGLYFEVTEPSVAFIEGLERLGVPIDIFARRVAV